MKIYAEFDNHGVCRRVLKVNDPSIIIEQSFEEVTGNEFSENAKPNEYRKVDGRIQKIRATEVEEFKIRIEKPINPMEQKLLEMESELKAQAKQIEKLSKK